MVVEQAVVMVQAVVTKQVVIKKQVVVVEQVVLAKQVVVEERSCGVGGAVFLWSGSHQGAEGGGAVFLR